MAAPAVIMLLYPVAVRVLPVGRRTEWFLGGDHVRHLIMAAEIQDAGWLTYGVTSYPRAWHTLLAAVWSACGLRPETDIVAVVDVSAVLVWLLSAGLTLTTAALAATLADRLGCSERVPVVAGFVAGTLTLWPLFLGNYQGLGLQTSLLAAGVVAAVLRTQLVDPTSIRALVVSAAGVVVISHTWQLVLPIVGLAALGSAVGLVRRRGTVGLWVVGSLGILSLAVSASSLIAVVTAVGVQHATDADVVAPVPWVVLLVGVVASVALLRWAGGVAGWAVGLMAVPAVTGLILAAYVGITPDTYYASKLLWHSSALFLAPISVVVALGMSRLRRVAMPRAVRNLAAGPVALGLAYSFALPAAAYVGVWSTVDGALVLRLLSTPGAPDAQVVWSEGPVVTDTVSRLLLDALRPEPGPLSTPQQPLTVEEECALLQAASDPVVLTDQPPEEVRRRFGCAPGVRVLRAE
ncbi:hypothetical protein [uncultured Phycicoccus sp.]|uniref:hypothetical protein n=1 Tax=uncultured Phycicoccus sp. TaxID=661422 RepID=UPI00261D4908|nr:hypothetical protein [uncultured Phycicoccus sp.]